MKKFLIRAGILIGVFVASVLIFSGIFNRKEIVDTRAMDSPHASGGLHAGRRN